MTKLTPARALAELKAQHDVLRGMLDRCDALSDELDAGRSSPLRLTREVARLRLAFEAHNEFEEHLLRPMLLEIDPFGTVRIDRMIEDHVEEHRKMGNQLRSGETAVLREVIETLRLHLEGEERYLLSSKVLRDDVVTVESSS